MIKVKQMVFIHKVSRRTPVYAGDGLLSSLRKLGKTASKLIKNPVGKVVHKIYDKTLAPVAKQALTGLVGEKLTNRLESVGKRTLKGENIDQAFVDEAKGLVKTEVNSALSGGRVARTIRTSDLIRSTTKPTVTKTIKPRASAVMQRISQEGNGLMEDTVL